MGKILYRGSVIHQMFCDLGFKQMPDGTYSLIRDKFKIGNLGDIIEDIRPYVNSDKNVCVITNSISENDKIDQNKAVYEYNFDPREYFPTKNINKKIYCTSLFTMHFCDMTFEKMEDGKYLVVKDMEKERINDVVTDISEYINSDKKICIVEPMSTMGVLKNEKKYFYNFDPTNYKYNTYMKHKYENQS